MIKKPEKRTLPEHTRKHYKEWFTGGHYHHRQPFQTFAFKRSTREYLVKVMRALVPNPRTTTALEIGPGQAPVIQALPFRKFYALEQSPALANELHRTVRGELTHSRFLFPNYIGSDYAKKWHIFTGSVEHIQFKPEERFGLVVANEVFTHVLPKNRINALEKITDMADSILIVDRPTVHIDVIKQNNIDQADDMLRRIAQSENLIAELGGNAAIEGHPIQEQKKAALAMKKHPLAFAKMAFSQQVDFDSFGSYLDKHGWFGQLIQVEGKVMLVAKRGKKRE